MEKLEKQNKMIMSLLARLVFKNGEDILKIVTNNKQNPSAWVQGYNACDGIKGVTEIARIVGVKQPTATPILKAWEDAGILFNMGTLSKPLYASLIKLRCQDGRKKRAQ